jgi:hypothetical protein
MEWNESVLNRISGYMDHLIKEVTEIHLNTNNFNRGSGFILKMGQIFGNQYAKQQNQAGGILDPAH